MPTGGEATPKIKPVEIAIASELHEKNRASYEDKQKQEEEERIRMVMEYIHFVMPRIADQGTVNHICGEVNNWIRLHSYKPKPIKGRLTKDVSNYCCPVKLFQTKQIRADTSHEVSALLVIFVLRKNI